jgi:hypothetical protein
MKAKFKKNYLSLAIPSLLLLSVANSNSAETAGINVDSKDRLRNSALTPSTSTRLASINSTGMASGNGFSDTPVLSADGRFVAFSSEASDLAANDTNDNFDVFVRDLKTGTTTLASVNSAGTDSGNGFSFKPVLSADGRFVAFISGASNLVANATSHAFNVFVRDLKTGTTTLASVNSAGTTSGNSSLEGYELSADGRFLVFSSNASDLVANDTNDTFDVFVRDLKAGTTKLLSVNSTGMSTGNGSSFSPVLSADGRFVAFESTANDLVANDTNDASDIFVRDIKTGTTTLASVNSAGTASGDGFSALTVLSANGRFVAFDGNANDLVANDTNDTFDVFVRDLKTGITKLLSVNSAGAASGNGFSGPQVLSADGRFVAFESLASDLVENDTNDANDVFVRDLKTGTTTLASVNSAGTATGNGFSFNPVLSANGRFVAFVSNANDLIANDTNDAFDVFVRDLKTGTTKLLSVNNAGTATGNESSFSPVLSANGRLVAFVSFANDLVANDSNNAFDVFVRPVGR